MTRTEMLELANLNRHIETVENLIPVKFPDATTEQFTHFRGELADAVTVTDKLEVAAWWLEWLVS